MPNELPKLGNEFDVLFMAVLGMAPFERGKLSILSTASILLCLLSCTIFYYCFVDIDIYMICLLCCYSLPVSLGGGGRKGASSSLWRAVLGMLPCSKLLTDRLAPS